MGIEFCEYFLYQRDFRMAFMAPPRDCIEFAQQCERLAALCADDEQLREHLLGLAREWLAMAQQEPMEPQGSPL